MASMQLTYDISVNKVARFVKDPDDLKHIYEIMLKYYTPLRDQFFE